TGEPVPDGEVGEVVVTTLNPDYPLIRFGTGDLSAVLPGTCPTGRTNMRIRGWMGRADQTAKVRGMFVHPSQVADIARRHPEVRRARLVVSGEMANDRMTLQVEVAQQHEGLSASIAQTIRDVTKLRGDVVLSAPGSLPNDGGAGGTLGATRVAKATPDGYTLLLAHAGILTAPALYRNLQYKTLDDFEFLGMINEVPMTLIGKPSLPANTFPELLKWLQANKGKINLANAGLGSASHLCGLMLQASTKIEMQTVPYKGTGPAMTDRIGGQVDLMCDQTTDTTTQIESGKVKAYGVTSKQRLTTPALAKLPTLDEVGLKGFNL